MKIFYIKIRIIKSIFNILYYIVCSFWNNSGLLLFLESLSNAFVIYQSKNVSDSEYDEQNGNNFYFFYKQRLDLFVILNLEKSYVIILVKHVELILAKVPWGTKFWLKVQR